MVPHSIKMFFGPKNITVTPSPGNHILYSTVKFIFNSTSMLDTGGGGTLVW